MEKPCQIGNRIRLLTMPDDPCPIAYGSIGTVRNIQFFQTGGYWVIDVDWDSKRSLSCISPPDTFEIISER